MDQVPLAHAVRLQAKQERAMKLSTVRLLLQVCFLSMPLVDTFVLCPRNLPSHQAHFTVSARSQKSPTLRDAEYRGLPAREPGSFSKRLTACLATPDDPSDHSGSAFADHHSNEWSSKSHGSHDDSASHVSFSFTDESLSQAGQRGKHEINTHRENQTPTVTMYRDVMDLLKVRSTSLETRNAP